MNGQWNMVLTCLVGRDIPLTRESTLRVAVMVDGDNVARELHLAIGTGLGWGWKEDPAVGGLSLPPKALEPLRDVLGELLDRVTVEEAPGLIRGDVRCI